MRNIIILLLIISLGHIENKIVYQHSYERIVLDTTGKKQLIEGLIVNYTGIIRFTKIPRFIPWYKLEGKYMEYFNYSKNNGDVPITISLYSSESIAE